MGGLTTRVFLRRYWQQRALLIRDAVPNFTGVLSDAALLRLATRDDVESRIVLREGQRWSVEHGPFRPAYLKALPDRNWTLLVQGVNLHVASADTLLRRFAFLPYARLDDLMVSYARPGGGVGPHFDSYDVFLLQGPGRRRWRISRQRDLSLRPSVPLKILAHFRPEFDHTLGAGDMLYLPPNYAHDGVAVETCTTYSIGFRAPAANELATAFLDWLRDHIGLEGRYHDAGLAPTTTPARIGDAMLAQCAAMLAGIRWKQSDIADFLGCFLTEPKAHVFFDPPKPPMGHAAFARKMRQRGVALDARTQLLYHADAMFINGETTAWPQGGKPAMVRLANQRQLTGFQCTKPLIAQLHGWYRDGFLHLA